MRSTLFGAWAFALGTALAGTAGAQTVVSDDVTVDTTWSGTVILDEPIFVRDGAVLTIQPGTILRGQPRTAAVLAGSVVGTPGALIVTRTGTIIANGTAAEPIIMTTAATDNNADGVADDFEDINGNPVVGGDGFADKWRPGDLFLDGTPTTAPLAPLNAAGAANVALWGGLVVNGNATTNLADAFGLGLGVGSVEGLTVPGFPAEFAAYGGAVGVGDDADSSGSLSYISVRHAGDEIGNSNELNGVTLAGVGTGTEIHHVEVYANFDDGIEWFGGTVNGHHMVVVFAGDDIFDGDEGYRGTNQFMVGISPYFNAVAGLFGSSSGDKGCEFDGDNFLPDNGIQNVNLVGGQQTPFPNYNFYNFTITGSAQPTTYNGHVNDNDGCEMRNGFAGTINNGLIFDTGVRQGLDLAGDAGGGIPGFTVLANATNGLIVANAISCDNVAALPALPQPERTVFSNGVRNNIACVSGGTDPDFRINQRVTSFVPTGVAGKLNASLASIDLRPSLPNATMADGIVPPPPLVNATYRGAFDTVSPKWTNGWTVLSMAGMTPVPEPGMAQLIGAGAMGLLALSRRRR